MGCEKQSELELLAKLEEQNRALFSDAKIVPSLQTHRRREGSLSSSISTGSGQDDTRSSGTPSFQNNGHTNYSSLSSSSKLNSASGVSLPLMIGWTAGAPVSSSIREQWDYVVNNWEQCSKKKSYVSVMRHTYFGKAAHTTQLVAWAELGEAELDYNVNWDLIKKGVPDEFRPLIWQLYTGAYDSAVKKHYHNYLLVDSPVEKAIRRDIARTFPKHDLFKDENGCGQESLFRVIKAYSIHDPEVGYCQGSAFIVGLLLMQMPELSSFAVLVQLMNDYRLREMYKPSMMELGVCMYQLEQLIADNLPDLYTHFRTQSFAPSLYASAWFLTLFSTILPIPFATRVMDFYIVEGLQFIFKLALSILKFSADNLLRCDMESMVAFLQHEGPIEWDKHSSVIFESACSFKLNTKKMKKLEKEYMTMRSQEREEQIELRRLRTENGLLLQRLARLEEESAVMADHLVKCQLIRAQEAEAAIALRCELAILRREYSLLNPPVIIPSQNTNEVLNSEAEDDINLISNHRMMQNGTQETTATTTSITTTTTTTTMEGSAAKTVPTTDTADTTVTDDSSNNTTNTKLTNGNNPQDNSVQQQTITNGYPMNSESPNYYSKVNFTIDSNHSPNSSYDFCTLPRSRNREHNNNNNKANNNNGTGKYNGEAKTDQLLSTTINQLQTDLVNSRFNEADAKKVSHELRCKLHELEESKTDQSLRAAEQIAVLKDELFGAKLRETELVNQIEEFKRRFDDLDSLWQMHLGKCKGVNNDTKRASLWIGSLNSLDASEMNNKMKFSDRILETRFINQISSLKQKITDLTAQQELSDRRADRLDKRVTELLESRTAFQARERELTMELKQLEQKCADIEAKRKADGVMWRSREMELKAQLAERKQGYLQLEYQYESLLTSQRLQVATGSGSQSLDNHDLCMRRKSSLDCDKLLEYNSNTTILAGIGATSNVVNTATNGTPNNNSSSINGVNSSNNNNSNKRFTLGSYLKFAQSSPHSTSLANSTASTPRVLNADNSNNDNDSSPSPYTVSSEVYSMWKDLPPSVMTESIGPLEDLCLIPDDPMITSVYINPSTSSTSSLSPTKEAGAAIAVTNTTTITLTTSPPPLTSSASVTSSLSSSNSQNF